MEGLPDVFLISEHIAFPIRSKGFANVQQQCQSNRPATAIHYITARRERFNYYSEGLLFLNNTALMCSVRPCAGRSLVYQSTGGGNTGMSSWEYAAPTSCRGVNK